MSLAPKSSDRSCFSPKADVKTKFSPECAECGMPAIGGVLDKVQDEVYTIRFGCGGHNEIFVMTVANMFPRWNAVSKIGPGLYKVVVQSGRPTTEVKVPR